jgi:ADP-heptose:LPS heptosyltransferase
LITRLSAIGDCVLTLPLADQLKAEIPDCHITWLVDCAASKLLEGHPSVDQVIRQQKGFLTKPAHLLPLRKQLQAANFDVALDPQGLLKSSLSCWFSGAKRRIGFGPPQARERSWWMHTDVVQPTAAHLVDKHLQLLEPLGITPPNGSHWQVGNCLAASNEATISSTASLENVGINGEPFALINPSAGWASRRWPPERFGRVAAELKKQHAISSVVVWAGEDEWEMAKSISAHSAGAASILPSTSLHELVALGSMATLMISSDSGPLHITAATGTPTVALFGPTDAAHSGPYGRQHQVIQNSKPLVRSKDRRTDDNSLMLTISVENVVEAASTIIEQPADL